MYSNILFYFIFDRSVNPLICITKVIPQPELDGALRIDKQLRCVLIWGATFTVKCLALGKLFCVIYAAIFMIRIASQLCQVPPGYTAIQVIH